MTENILGLDFETTSKTDLPAEGLGKYLVDPTTRAYCFTWRFPDMSTADLWIEGQPVPARVVAHIRAGGLVMAHNAPFDYHIWNEILCRDNPQLPEIKPSQVRCSAARARYNGLPGSLAGACAALGLPVQKDTAGGDVMKQIAAHPEWTIDDHPEEFARVFKYAIIDTDAMIGLWDATVPLPAREQAFFELDMEINARGFGVDIEGAEAVEELKQLAEVQIDYQVAVLTGGGVLAATEIAKIKEFAHNIGTEVDDASKEALKKLIARDDLPSDLRDLLALRLDASRAPKKSAAILRAHVNRRL